LPGRDAAAAPAWLFVAASLLFGAALGAVTPPLHVPDEQAHFYRAYRISEGRFDLVPEPRVTFRALPRSLWLFSTTALADLRFQPDRRLPPGTFGRLAGLRLEPDDRVLVHFPQTLQYTCLPYLVPAAAIAAGRLAGAEPLALLYLARAANLVFGTLAVVAALRLLPALRWWLVALALTPMAVALRASASADVLAMSAGVVLLAAAWRMVSGVERAGPSLLALATAAGAVLGAARPPYAPLALLPLLAPAARLAVRSPWAWRVGHLLAVTLATGWGVLTALAVGYTRPGSGIDPSRQLRFALEHPATALEAVLVDYTAHAPRYLVQLVGKLGWLDTRLPLPLIGGYLLLLLGLLLVDGNARVRVLPSERLAVLGTLLATVLGIAASQYLVWAPVGATRLPDGVQGRYFLPVALAAAWSAHTPPRGGRDWQRRLPRLMAGAALVTTLVTLHAVWRRYYG
jgi:uncharacterized membrane protein